MDVNDTEECITQNKQNKEYKIFKISKNDTLEDSVKNLERFLDECREENKKCH